MARRLRWPPRWPHVDFQRRVPPRRSNSCSCSTRRILACVLGSCRPPRRGTSCRVGLLEAPMRCLSAPVKAPFSWPKSSDSRRFSCSAAQFTFTKVPDGPEGVVVNRAGDQLLAGAGLAVDQDGRVALGDLADDAQHLLERARAATIESNSVDVVLRVAQVVDLVAHPTVVEGLADLDLHLLDLERLLRRSRRRRSSWPRPPCRPNRTPSSG